MSLGLCFQKSVNVFSKFAPFFCVFVVYHQIKTGVKSFLVKYSSFGLAYFLSDGF